MPMWLTSSGMLAGVEEREELFSLASPCLQAGISNAQIILLKQVCLFLELRCGQYKVFGDDSEFIENQYVVTEVAN